CAFTRLVVRTSFSSLLLPLPPRYTLSPYTTLFRSSVFVVLGNHLAIIHLIKLVSRQDRHMIVALILQVIKRLTNRIGRPLKPMAAVPRLFGRQDIYITAAKESKVISIFNMLIQRS